MTTIELRRVTAVGVLVALTVALTAITWYGLLAGAIWGLVLLCAGHARSVRRRLGPDHVRDGANLRYHLCALGVLYLVPIGVAATFYCLVAAWVESSGGTASTDRLIALQRAFEETSSFFSDNLKLSESVVLGVLVGVHLLTCLLLAKGTRHRRPDAGHGVAVPDGARAPPRHRVLHPLQRAGRGGPRHARVLLPLRHAPRRARG
ncbi:hypothetical protein [Micromonospora globbae]|uniref:Uncharacterized protein n=1 Tax=Micromonospora globbae TaxID=1894969 RepID=A0A420F0P7_9ACTN|nr:hypothetical protein [Micromonospora globbae]RKF26508.1 hypothetical protein D7I43_16080 [Micromonospora globbae]